MLYFDYAASSRLRRCAADALLDAQREPGNPASVHAFGRRAEAHVDRARDRVAALVGRQAREVIWTSGGTEANNLALLGLAMTGTRRHLIVSAIEHKSILGPASRLEAMGWTVTRLPVDADGIVAAATLAMAMCPDTALVSIMAVNNEVGSVQPLAKLVAIARTHGALFHVDAVQAAGLLDLAGLDADMISLSGHKIGAPMGIGALVVRAGTPLKPILFGAGQQRGLRPGTLPVPAIAAFGAAAEEAFATRASESTRLGALRAELASRILAGVPAARALGRADAVAPHILCLTFRGLAGEALVTQLDLAGLAASSGAACTTLGAERGHMLQELGLDAAEVAGGLRLSLGWATTADEVSRAAAIVVSVASGLLAMSPRAC